ERSTGIFFPRDTRHLALAVLDLAQFAKDRSLLGDVFRFGNLAGFEPHLKFEQPLLDGSVVGVLLLRDLGEGAKDELHRVDGNQQQIVDQKHRSLSSPYHVRVSAGCSRSCKAATGRYNGSSSGSRSAWRCD